MTYVHWVSATECESRYQRRAAMPWESNYSKPTANSKKPDWMNSKRKVSTQQQGTLKGVDEALLVYERGRTRQTFEAILGAIGDWFDSTNYEQMDQDPSRRRKTAGGSVLNSGTF